MPWRCYGRVMLFVSGVGTVCAQGAVQSCLYYHASSESLANDELSIRRLRGQVRISS
jgi:hypothetical protein